jgi:FkbM family methyltransferase
MMSFIKRLVPRSLKQRTRRLFGLPQTRLHRDWSVLGIIGPVDTEHVVLDIGAHHGWFFHCWQDWCPTALIHAFEPYPESFDTMRRLYGSDTRVRLNQVGVGEQPGELRLNVFSESKVSNSFLATDARVWDTLRYHTGTATQISVPVTTVDEYVREHQLQRVYLAKIDVQGYEMHVLRGAEKSLPLIDHLFIEVGIERLYEGAPRFSDVFEFLAARGFHLMTMRAWHRGNRVLMETDMLFRRNGLAPSVDESVTKVMEQLA